ncbi:MAG: diguanylate cyclase [Treponema sp.]|jgi:diguanylate cyclase (GGDEF)-like protein|nr:diguanylate cyclase [Treponema sp.]
MEKKKKKILIVDDEKMNIIALAHFLEQQYEIIMAANGTSALEAAEKHVPDIILLDVLMPDMSGFDVLVRLKNSTATMHIPVIFITGLTGAVDEARGLSLGAVDYITKPFNKSIVKARIKTHLKMSEYVHTIEKLCMLDGLTGIPNRRGFDARMKAEWGRAHRDQKPLGLIMLDIDNFKKYNDTYGHPQGDVLLTAIADVLTKTLNRSTDFASRWGGEEFTVLLPDTGVDGTNKIAEQMRINIKDTLVPCGDGTITSATVSLGAISIIPGVDDLAANFIAEADKLLYNAKKAGKNRVCCAVSEGKDLFSET